jgi:hypothetical protein
VFFYCCHTYKDNKDSLLNKYEGIYYPEIKWETFKESKR